MRVDVASDENSDRLPGRGGVATVLTGVKSRPCSITQKGFSISCGYARWWTSRTDSAVVTKASQQSSTSATLRRQSGKYLKHRQVLQHRRRDGALLEPGRALPSAIFGILIQQMNGRTNEVVIVEGEDDRNTELLANERRVEAVLKEMPDVDEIDSQPGQHFEINPLRRGIGMILGRPNAWQVPSLFVNQLTVFPCSQNHLRTGRGSR